MNKAQQELENLLINLRQQKQTLCEEINSCMVKKNMIDVIINNIESRREYWEEETE